MSAWGVYYPEGDARSGGMRNQVLLYTMTSPAGGARSRMPWISEDKNTLYFAQGSYAKEELWYSSKSAGRWLPARKINELNVTGYSSQSPSLDSSMNRIYFTSTRPVGAPYNQAGGRWRIWTATRKVDGTWNTPYFMNDDAVSGAYVTIYTDGHDFGVSLSRDGNNLYINSSRSLGLGTYDIWMSTLTTSGKWTQPVNLGAPINSSAWEMSGVSVSKDNRTLYFGSDNTVYRKLGTDTYNIYQAVRSSTTQAWSTASVSQLGGFSPVTTSVSWGVLWPCISDDGLEMYYSDDGPFKYPTDGFDIFVSRYTSGNWSKASNLGRGVNNIIWHRDEDFLPFVAYIDATTYQPRDCMFDSILFLALSGSSSGNRYDLTTYKDDWTDYLDQMFSPERQLDRLNSVVGSVNTTLNNLSYKVKITVMIPYPSKSVTNFGDVDGDGLTENLSTDTIRMKVMKWYLNDFYSRWSSANLTNLNLVAMYWMSELAGSADSSVIKQVSNEVHNRGSKFEWIPYYNATNYSIWSTLGFDIVEYQPNYAWLSQSDTTRIPLAAAGARNYNMGVELEFDSSVMTWDSLNYRTYLDYGTGYKENYMKNCLLGWYQDSYNLAPMSYTSLTANPISRDGYDNTYQFIKEIYPYPLSAGKSYTLSTTPSASYPDATRKLCDYLYLPDVNTSARVVGFQNANPSVTFDLVSSANVEKVYAHFAGGNYNTISFPANMSVDVSNNGSSWTGVGSTVLHATESGTLIPGEMMLKFAPTNVRYVRVNFIRNTAWIWLDEITIYGNYQQTSVTDWSLY
jgi:hypothetical protein